MNVFLSIRGSFVLSLAGVFLLSARVTSCAWSAPGHMVIAAIAYNDLTISERTKINDILKSHPDYLQWKARYETNAGGVDLNTLIFLRASTWPDAIRRSGNPYDHPEWHYIDYPLEPPAFPEKPDPYPTNDILFGIKQSEKIIIAPTSTDVVRGAYLSWLIHLVGDIHQPLHCATLVNSVYPAPAGDKGGNAFFVRPAEAPVNLHSIWDQALGSSANPQTELNYAVMIRNQYPRDSLPELVIHKSVEAWSIESRNVAIESAYLHGSLKGSNERQNAPPLPDDYTKTMKAISERQAALAGYRLADEIRKCLQ